MKGSAAPKRSHRLTQETLRDGFVHEMIARSGTNLPVLSDAERHASLQATLAAQPAPGEVWLFGYGSLIWNPAFHHTEQKPVLIRGWHREFCLSTPIGRGTPDAPGLVLGLDSGGSCRGVAFRIARAEAEAELELVWRREMVTGAYVPRWVSAARSRSARRHVRHRLHDQAQGPELRPARFGGRHGPGDSHRLRGTGLLPGLPLRHHPWPGRLRDPRPSSEPHRPASA
ncbi:gamma-glutamylcyclotransferase [Microvirga sp. SYSU G3D207]|uniref:glutathione-specific gamma-glutamylcyclotransferase n=1 Tax=Microvirga arsenatis TaxID=2692265 RepID=A0ABW9YVT7_9HYPH|nr:gamma-glutamylcyclotransferase [Microvirga arsenatis]NBJ10713.1 gamma-glutamylcyclotransferase [Microvirga arsenatis]NBJ24389.1 gamma-glutamylcyclotransferase [Microvirga arsenatis]